MATTTQKAVTKEFVILRIRFVYELVVFSAPGFGSEFKMRIRINKSQEIKIRFRIRTHEDYLIFDVSEEKELQDRVEKLSNILSGEKPIYLHLQFLIRNDHTDPLILKNTKVIETHVSSPTVPHQEHRSPHPQEHKGNRNSSIFTSSSSSGTITLIHSSSRTPR
jgi:hypothetical protein